MKPLALITGAGIGIGRACALRLASAGYHVVATDVLPEEGAAVVSRIRDSGGAAEFVELDVADSAAVAAVVADAEARHGRAFRAIVNNAGIAKHMPLATLTDEQWDRIQEVDLKGMMRVMRAALPGMRAAGEGAVVCLSSIAGFTVGWGDHIPYATAKAGVSGLVRAAAIEFAGDGVRVNGVAPGLIRTAQSMDPVHSLGPEGLEAAAPGVPLRRIGDPEDVANLVNFLLGSESAYITGQIITIDGGLTVAL